VDEVEELTTGLSRKVWQKIAILDQIMARQIEQDRDLAAARGGRRRGAIGWSTSGAKARRRG
jgi:hypothetical protein